MDLTEKKDSSDYRHPWEISRASSILSLQKDIKYENLADIGSGDLYFAEKLSNFSGKMIYACDVNYEDVELGKSKDIITVSDIKKIPERTMDLIFLLDVLEHVDREDTFLKEVSSLLSPEGRILITVPAFQFLFGEHDVFLKHFRRYSKDHLNKVLKRNDLVVEKTFYFYSSLFTVKTILKLVSLLGIQKKYENSVSSWCYPREHFLTRICVFLLNADFSLNRFLYDTFKITMPGLSLCAIAKKHA